MPIFPTQRPDPAIGQLLVNDSSAHSSYDGMLVTANFQLPKRSQLMANYTLSRTRDNNSNLGPFTRVPGAKSVQPARPTAQTRRSMFATASTSAPSPTCPKGFKVNPILVARSGYALHTRHWL